MAARATVAGLTVAMAAIHLHLWSTGYNLLPTIGVLFLLNAIGGIVLAVALLTVPARHVAAASAVTAAFTASTLLGLVLSLNTGLFGFREFTGAPFVQATLVVESVGLVAAAALTAIYAPSALRWWRSR